MPKPGPPRDAAKKAPRPRRPGSKTTAKKLAPAEPTSAGGIQPGGQFRGIVSSPPSTGSCPPTPCSSSSR